MAKPSDDNIELLLNKLLDKAEDSTIKLANLDKKIDLHIQKTEYELQRINEMDEVQNRLLDEHISGVNTLKDIHVLYAKATDARLEVLETPRKWIQNSFKILIVIGAISGAIAGITKLLN